MLLSLILSLFASLTWADSKLCDQVLFKDQSISLSVNEKILVCGSPKGSEAWKSVPLSQSEYQMRIFLQNRGYLSPSFERHGDVLWVWSGPRTVVEHFVIEQGREHLDGSKRRRVIGHPMTSELLDDVTHWAELELRSQGYPCPKVAARAQLWDRTLVISADKGKRARVRSLQWEGRDSLNERVLDRYSAISKGSYYDVRESQLTTSRLFSDGLFETAAIQPQCNVADMDLVLRTSVGKPKLVTFGVGASTEEWIFTDVGFRNSRLDDRASSFFARMHVSPLQQNLSLGSELYSFSFWPSIFWGPRFRTGREKERAFEVVQAKAGVDLGRYWDQWKVRWAARGGPTLNYVNTVMGVGPSESSYLNWEGSLVGMSHAYEFHMREQSTGWIGQFNYIGQRNEVGSSLNVDRFDLAVKYLWNVNKYSPPLFVLASRFEGTVVNANSIDIRNSHELLPVDYRIYWGGDKNMRGFARQSLNNDRLGYLTGAYAGFELRMVEQLPYKIEPFLLYDYGKLGRKRLTLDEPDFMSWGAGLRWASPFGTLRGSVAQGEIQNADSSALAYKQEWVYFLSFGQEF